MKKKSQETKFDENNQTSSTSDLESKDCATSHNEYEIPLPKVFQETEKKQIQEEIESDPTLRKVELLANLANSIKDKTIQKSILALPDGQIILNVFKEAINAKIGLIMASQIESQVNNWIGEVSDNIFNLNNNINNLNTLSEKIQNLFVYLHKSPLVDVLIALTESLNKTKLEQNTYQNQHQQTNSSAPTSKTSVSPYFESQIEQTPKFTKQRKENQNSGVGPALTAPPRGSDDIGFW